MSKRKKFFKSYYIPPPWNQMSVPGQVPTREAVEARAVQRMAETEPPVFNAAMLLEHTDPMLRPDAVVSGLGFSLEAQRDWSKFLEKAVQTSTNEIVLRRAVLEKSEGMDDAIRRAILQRSLRYWRTKMGKSMIQVVTVDELHKGLFIGPLGGKWADVAHTIHYDPDKPGGQGSSGTHEKEKVASTSTLVSAEPKLLVSEDVKLDAKAEAPEPAPIPEAAKKGAIKPEDPDKLAQEIGEHVWGSRADLAALRNADDLDKLSPANQAKIATKKYLMPDLDVESLLASGVEPGAILYRKALEGCIQAGAFDNLVARKLYIEGIDFVTRSLDACKSLQDIYDFVKDWQYLCQSQRFEKAFTREEYQQVFDDYMKHIGKPVAMEWPEREQREKKLRMAEQAYYRAPRGAEREAKQADYEQAKKDAESEGYVSGASFGVAMDQVVGWKLGLTAHESSAGHTPFPMMGQIGLSLEFDSGGGVRVYRKDPELEKTNMTVGELSVKANRYGIMLACLGKKMVLAIQYSGLNGPSGTKAPKALDDAYHVVSKWDQDNTSYADRVAVLGELMEGKKAGGKPKKPPFRWERPESGEVKRKGGQEVLSADPTTLAGTFGFKNVQFGNWVDEGDAKSHLIGAQGALLDLSELLGVDPKSLSLHGRLSIGFGARGTGKAIAHYEPGGKIINLTKMSGGGSLCHEWAHALDHLVSLSGNPSNTKAMPMMSDGQVSGVNPKVALAMREVMTAIRYSEPSEKYKAIVDKGETLDARYRAKDKLSYDEQRTLRDYYRERSKLQKSEFLRDAESFTGKDSYWTRPHELFARAFESVIQDVLTEQGRESSYLVYATEYKHRTGKFSSKENEAAGKDAQPYPHGEDRKRIGEKVRALLKVLKADNTLEKALNKLDGIRFILQKGEARGGKYHRRIPAPGGGYRYIYDEEKYQARKDAHISGTDAEKGYIHGRVHSAIERAGKGGCGIETFKALVQKYGSQKVSEVLRESVDGGKLAFKKGKFFTVPQENSQWYSN